MQGVHLGCIFEVTLLAQRLSINSNRREKKAPFIHLAITGSDACMARSGHEINVLLTNVINISKSRKLVTAAEEKGGTELGY